MPNKKNKEHKQEEIMGERHGSLVSVRPDVKVVDCTLRDGDL